MARPRKASAAERRERHERYKRTKATLERLLEGGRVGSNALAFVLGTTPAALERAIARLPAPPLLGVVRHGSVARSLGLADVLRVAAQVRTAIAANIHDNLIMVRTADTVAALGEAQGRVRTAWARARLENLRTYAMLQEMGDPQTIVCAVLAADAPPPGAG